MVSGCIARPAGHPSMRTSPRSFGPLPTSGQLARAPPEGGSTFVERSTDHYCEGPDSSTPGTGSPDTMTWPTAPSAIRLSE